MFKDIMLDIKATKGNPILVFISNRGFHALLIYRISHFLWKKKIPLIPLLFTRIIQILYAIDIDYRARIEGGCMIVHGVGLVIGSKVIIKKGCKLYHEVTLGIAETDENDGLPILEENVIIGAGAKVLGKIRIGKNAKIGANSVVIRDVPENHIAVGIPAKNINKKRAQ